MRLRTATLLGLLVLTPSALEANEQGRVPHRWWQSEEVRTELDLTDEQSASLDRIYQQTLPKQRESMRRLYSEQRTLSQLIGDMTVQEIDVTRQIIDAGKRLGISVHDHVIIAAQGHVSLRAKGLL